MFKTLRLVKALNHTGHLQISPQVIWTEQVH